MHSKISWQPHHLEDERLKLVPLKENDFERLYAIAADPLIWEQHPSSDRYKRPVFQEFFNQAIASQGAFIFIHPSTGEVMGSSRYYDYSEANSSVAIGYTFLARTYWGGPFNRSAKTMMIDYAFQHVDKVIFHIGTNNIRSQIATSRFGARKTGEIVKESANGISRSYEYTILKEEWLRFTYK